MTVRAGSFRVITRHVCMSIASPVLFMWMLPLIWRRSTIIVDTLDIPAVMVACRVVLLLMVLIRVVSLTNGSWNDHMQHEPHVSRRCSSCCNMSMTVITTTVPPNPPNPKPRNSSCFKGSLRLCSRYSSPELPYIGTLFSGQHILCRYRDPKREVLRRFTSSRMSLSSLIPTCGKPQQGI